MKTENRQATCHIRIYDKDGLVLSTNPTMDANYLAHMVLDIIKEYGDNDE